MAELIIDDEYYHELRAFMEEKGRKIDETVSAFIKTMESVRDLAVISGELSEVLKEYILNAGRLSGALKTLSEEAGETLEAFIREIEEADQYQF